VRCEAYLNQDIYRVSVSSDSPGWSGQLRNALVAVKFGESVAIPVYIFGKSGKAPGIITVKAQSESDPTKVASVKLNVQKAD